MVGILQCLPNFHLILPIWCAQCLLNFHLILSILCAKCHSNFYQYVVLLSHFLRFVVSNNKVLKMTKSQNEFSICSFITLGFCCQMICTMKSLVEICYQFWHPKVCEELCHWNDFQIPWALSKIRVRWNNQEK